MRYRAGTAGALRAATCAGRSGSAPHGMRSRPECGTVRRSWSWHRFGRAMERSERAIVHATEPRQSYATLADVVPRQSERSMMSSTGRSNWERADAVASGLGTAARGVGWVIVRLYALGLIALGGVFLFLADGPAALIGLLVIAYGLYLLFGGSWIVY